MLKKENRLTKRKEFGFIYKKGKKVNAPYFYLVFTTTKLKQPRFGFVVGKKIGKSYKRNKIKRQLREIVRTNLQKFNPTFNYILVAKPEILQTTYQQLETCVLDTFKSANLLN